MTRPEPESRTGPIEPVDLSVELAPARGLHLRHPVIVAAGGAGFGSELLEAVGDLTPGAIVTSGVGRDGRQGPAPPRMAMLADALISAVGQGPGIDEVLRRQASRWAARDVPVIVSICGEDAAAIAELATRLEVQPGVAGIELDLDCADRGRKGAPIGIDVDATEVAVVSARAATELPLIVKLTPAAPDPREIAHAAAAAGADAISAIGRLTALALDDGRRGPALGSTYGGLSGPALKPVGLRIVYEIAQVVHVPIIGVGGISSLDDVLDYLAAGASAVGLATAALADPSLPGRLALELEGWCRAHGLAGPRELVGSALPSRRDRGSLRRR